MRNIRYLFLSVRRGMNGEGGVHPPTIDIPHEKKGVGKIKTHFYYLTHVDSPIGMQRHISRIFWIY